MNSEPSEIEVESTVKVKIIVLFNLLCIIFLLIVEMLASLKITLLYVSEYSFKMSTKKENLLKFWEAMESGKKEKVNEIKEHSYASRLKSDRGRGLVRVIPPVIKTVSPLPSKPPEVYIQVSSPRIPDPSGNVEELPLLPRQDILSQPTKDRVRRERKPKSNQRCKRNSGSFHPDRIQSLDQTPPAAESEFDADSRRYFDYY